MQIGVDWATLKSFAQERNLSIQYVQTSDTYYLWAIDGQAEVSGQISITGPASSDQSDFETNFKPTANAPILPTLTSVTTQFEIPNKTLKLFCGEGDVQSDSTATILMLVPGTPGSGKGRFINSGEAFFDAPTAGDKILGVWFVDHDNILGGGVDAVIGSYTDDAAPLANQGWYLPPVRGTLKAETIGYYGFAPSGFYMKIVAKKANGITTGKLFINIEWAIQG